MSKPSESKIEELRLKWGRIKRLDLVPVGFDDEPYDGEIWVRQMTKFDWRKYHQRQEDDRSTATEQTAYDLVVYPEDAERDRLFNEYCGFLKHIENACVLSSGLATKSLKKE